MIARHATAVLLAVLIALGIVGGSSASSASSASTVSSASSAGVRTAEPDIPALCTANPSACTVMTEPTGGAEDAPATGSIDDATQGIVSPTVETQNTLAAINEFTPENAVESWAQAAAEGAVSILGKVSVWQDKVKRPAFDSTWWQQQYAIMFGLSLMLFAFLLVVVVAKVGGPDGSVSAAQLLRDSGLKVWLVPVILALAPVILAMVQGGAAELAKTFARESGDDASNATSDFLQKMTALSTGFDAFGGAILALLILLGILVFSVALLIEVALASWGLNILGLVIPIAVVMHIYPPWRRPLARIIGLMLGLLFTPVAVNFVYWTFWSTTSNLADGLDLFGISLFVLIGSLLLASAPLLTMWLFPMVVPASGRGPAPVDVARAYEPPAPRTVNRLSSHFRTKEALSAHAPMVHAPEREGVRATQHAPGWVTRTDEHTTRRASAADLPEKDSDSAMSDEPVIVAHEQVAAQLGSKNSEETFDPEPFDPPRDEQTPERGQS